MGISAVNRKIYSVGGSGGSSGSGVTSVVAGTNISVDNTDPANPIVSTTANKITVVANFSALPAANTVSGKFYWADASQGTRWLPGSLGGTYYSAGLYYSNGTTWEFLDVPYQATQATVDTGTNTDQFVTPSTFTNASKWGTKQDTLVSGTNIKTVNSNSLLGSGNVSVGDALVANPLSQFASTTSAQLATVLSDETGSGSAVFGTGPTLSLPVIDNLKIGYTTTATAAGTTTLTSSSNFKQFFTGTTTQTITLPVASTMVLGQGFEIHNNSTGTLTINSSGGNLVATLEGGKTGLITCILTSGTTAASWDIDYTGASTNTGTGALVFGTSPTFTTQITTPLIYGSSSGSGTLTLSSTSNATKGKILLGANGAYDEVNKYFSPNTTSPTAVLDINDNGTGQLTRFLMRTSGLAHSFTSIVASDVYGFQGWFNATLGGYFLGGVSKDGTNPGFTLIGYSGATAGVTAGCMEFRGSKRSGTTTTALSSTDVMHVFTNNGTVSATMLGNGSLKLASTGSPTAYLHLPAGTATSNTAPLKFTSGTNLTTAETGAIEYNGTNLFFTRTETTRETVFTGTSGASSPAFNTIGLIVDYIGTSDSRVLTTPNSWASVVIGGTTYKIPLYT